MAVLATNVLLDGYDRVQGAVHEVVADLSPKLLNARPVPDTNSITWLIWHLTRIQDLFTGADDESGQVWLADGWQQRFALHLPQEDTGYGHTSAQVGAVRVDSGSLLTGYYDAVHARTQDYLQGLTAAQLDEVADPSWDPPVTLGVRLVSVLADDLQHVGQAAYVRGLLLND